MLAEAQFAQNLAEFCEAHLALVLLVVFEDCQPLVVAQNANNAEAPLSFEIVGRKEQFRGMELQCNLIIWQAESIQQSDCLNHLVVNALIIERHPSSDIACSEAIIQRFS